jgi:hypothetical protein
MNGFDKYLSATFLSAVVLCPCSAQAMQIQQFDKMVFSDQGDYLVVLIEGAQRVLIETGRRDLADKVHRLFRETPRSDDAPIGVTVFEINLAKGPIR